MTKSTCLHIQDRESGPVRAVEIPWISVRIGRAAYCEVRLSEHDLAEIACQLKRRGNSWYLVPVATASPVRFEGRPVDGPCLLPFDVPFHVGGYCLTLRQDRTAEPDWGLYGTPKPRAFEEVRPVDKPETTPVPASGNATAADLLPEDRTSEPVSPRATEEPDPSTVPDPSPADILKHRWESRWRAAGAEIKSRAERYNPAREPARPAYGAGFESVPLKEPPTPRSSPIVPPRTKITDGTDRAVVGQHSSAIPLIPCDRAAPMGDVPPIDLPRDRSACDAPDPRGAPASFWDHWAPTDEIVDSLAQESPPPHDGGALTEPPAAFDVPAPQRPLATETPSEEVRGDQPSVESMTAETLEEHRGGQGSALTATALAAAALLEAAADEGIRPSPPLPAEGKLVGKSAQQQSEPRAARSVSTARPNDSRTHHASSSAESHQTPDGLLYAAALIGTRGAVARSADRKSEGQYTDPDDLQWPSAREILAAHQAARRSRTQPAVRQQTRSGELPTVSRAPGQWLLPAWLTGPPIALLVLVCGTAGCILSLAWAGDSYSASIMTERLLSARTGGPKRPLPDGVAPSEGTWVRTTAQHLAHWGLYNSRSGDADAGPTSPDVKALFEQAMQVSPINPTARLGLAQLDRGEGAAVVSIDKLGLSRDGLSLATSARWLLAAGRKDAALETYRKALEIASHRELSGYGAPRFSDDPAAPRYLLPGEDAVREVVRAVISQREWTFADWSRILPMDSNVPLVAARLLRAERRHDAEELMVLFLRADEHRTRKRADDPVLAAARAEAHALLSHWKEAEQEYHQAIDLIDDDTIRRSWWFNLADIALRLEDDGQRQTALRAALAVQTSDDISRRATESQRSAGQRARLRSTGTRAN
ncbi:MAG: hypothetical protein ACLQVF_11505 [Isosphaeraceae bacterium]